MKKIYTINEAAMALSIVEEMKRLGVKLPSSSIKSAKDRYNQMSWHYDFWGNRVTIEEN